jgi:hypothetical protein
MTPFAIASSPVSTSKLPYMMQTAQEEEQIAVTAQVKVLNK